MINHGNEHLLNVVYEVPEHNIVSPFDLYEDVLEFADTDAEFLC